jgi:hypothetical protein
MPCDGARESGIKVSKATIATTNTIRRHQEPKTLAIDDEHSRDVSVCRSSLSTGRGSAAGPRSAHPMPEPAAKKDTRQNAESPEDGEHALDVEEGQERDQHHQAHVRNSVEGRLYAIG